MIINEDKKFIFLEVPKTGTSAIVTMLKKIDKANRRNYLPLGDGRFETVVTHITFREVCRKLGKRAADYKFIAFVRDPFDVVISKYYFYKIGRSWQQYRGGAASRGLALRVLFARYVPLPIWTALYPYKSTAHFVLDDNGDIKIDHIGDFKKLQDEVIRIFSDFGYGEEELQLGVENKSPYSAKSIPFRGATKWIVKHKSRRDHKLYHDLVGHSPPDIR